ncbi:MAG: DNA polymerase III subunit delta [Oscillospiraceae bacterium]|nr:DNA polymerase III subunit delta [Oscillospiraceae bacterium]
MPLSALAGNAALKEQLLPRLRQGRLGHAFILSGPAGAGKGTLAAILARALVCSQEQDKPCGCCPACKKALAGIHPDIITLRPEEEGKAITVDQIRWLRSDAHIRPNEAARKVYVLPEADRLRDEAQNAMLKLLEDGPPYAAFLLLAENAGGLLTTVRSRCQELSLTRPQGADDPCSDPDLDALAGQLADLWMARDEQGLLRLCVEIERTKWERARCFALLDRLSARFTRQMTQGSDPRQALRGVQVVEQLRGTRAYNMSVGHMVGWLCASVMGK